MTRPFVKMHGLGNDFVIFDSRADGWIADEAACRHIADRHRGVGCDQLVFLIKPPTTEANLFMHMANADGSVVRACGNATRCVAQLLFEETERSEGTIQTIAGFLKVRKEQTGLIAVDFGPPRLEWQDIPLAREANTLSVPLGLDNLADPCCVNMGNPHAVFFVENADAVPLAILGPTLETHPLFPDRANISFAHMTSRDRIRLRVWERGTGMTQACGSAACATLVAAVRRKLGDRRATVTLDGGDLEITWREDDHVVMSGTATFVFRGLLAADLLGESRRSNAMGLAD